MSKIAPFRGLRYHPERVELSQVVSPPYDVIDDAGQDALYRRSPFNVVRVDLAKEENGLTRYQIAARNFEKWKQEGILRRDPEPSLYLYFQTYHLPNGETKTRKGFFAARRLEKFGEGGVKPHENTFPGPKADRLQLMRATHANLSPIFGLFSDPKGEVESQLDALSKENPDAEVREANGDIHRLWVVSDPPKIERLIGNLHDRPLLIADGHHRYETAVAFAEERQLERDSSPTGDEPFNYVLMYFCSLQDPGLVVLPTHRVLNQAPEIDADIFRGLLEKYARIISFPASDLQAATAKMEAEGNREHVLGWVHDGKIDVLIFDQDRILENPALNRLHFSLRDLDVTILHDLVLTELIGITKGAQKEYGVLSYVKDAAETLRLATEKKSYAFLMNATKLKQIEAVSEIGEKMPQKSTFFYPKLLTGLVFNEL